MEREILPKTFVPRHYDLHIKPFVSEFKFDGVMSINFELTNSVSVIQLNAVDLNIKTVNLKIGEHYFSNPNITYDKDTERVSFDFMGKLPIGTGTLDIIYNGDIRDDMSGFYRSHYVEDGVDKYCAVTQFEATSARKVFPCVDEPEVKAEFSVKITIPENSHKTVLSNMPVKSIISEHGLTSYTFDRSIKMSTYLLAFFVGDMDYVEENITLPFDDEHVDVRVYTPVGKPELGTFALDVACRTLKLFSEYFNINYPLGKLDMIGLPDFAAGAMENWGLVTYRSKYIYFEEGVSSTSSKEQIASVVCHELAHQWFGNLVTMKWWNDLWLNEGFATWVGTMAVNELFPEWKAWEGFISGEYTRALELDQLDSSHPIQVDVNKASEIDEIFDAISYSKGASAIHMLVNYMGEENFKNGMRHYLQLHKLGNAKTEDLWSALSTTGADINSFMHNWVREQGYPLVEVTRKGNTVTVSQQKYATDGDTLWQVPLNVLDESGNVTKSLLVEKNMTFETTSSWIKLNHDSTGIYRTKYSHDMLEALKPVVRSKTLGSIDRAELVYNLFGFAEKGYGSITDFLDFVSAYKDEDNLVVTELLQSNLAMVSNLWFDMEENLLKKYNEYRIDLLKGLYEKYGWNAQTEYNDTMMQRLVLTVLSNCGYTPVVNRFQNMFQEYIKSELSDDETKSNISPDLIMPMLKTVVKHGTLSGPFNVEDLHNMYRLHKGSSSNAVQANILRALGNINDIKLLNTYLHNAMYGDSELLVVKDQDLYLPFTTSNSGDLRYESWTFIRDNWNKLTERVGEQGSIFGHIVGSSLKNMVDTANLTVAKGFIESKGDDVKNIQRTLSQALEKVESSIAWRNRDTDSVVKFLSALP
jgi:aminopeptidase N